MGQYILGNDVTVLGSTLRRGRTVDDEFDDIPMLVRAGAVLLPISGQLQQRADEVQTQASKGLNQTEQDQLVATEAEIGGGGGGVPPTRLLTAGAGLTGGGDLSADRTFNVVANVDGSIIVNPNDIKVGTLASDGQHGVRGGGNIHAVATSLLAGFMSAADKSKLDGIGPGSGGVSFIAFGNEKVGATVTTRYLSPYNDGDVIASSSVVQFQAPQGGTLKRLVVRHGVPAGNGNAIVYTVRINGVATFLAVSLASTSFAAVDAVNTVTFAANDLIDVRVTKALGVGTSPTNVIASMEIV
jgi:hypothetical protein